MNVITQFAEVAVLGLPVFVAVGTEVLKRIKQVPVSSSNAKYVALALSVVLVAVKEWGGITLDTSIVVAGEMAAVYFVSVGFYESVKRFVKKV